MDATQEAKLNPNPPLYYRGYAIHPWLHDGATWTCKIYAPDGEWAKTLPRSGRYTTFCRMQEMAETFIDVDIDAIASHAETTEEFGI